MKILFDHQTFCIQTHGGVSRCFAELYKHMPSGVEAHIALKECNNAYIREMKLVPPENDTFERWLLPYNWPLKSKMFTAWQCLQGHRRDYYWYKFFYNQSESIRLLKNGDFDVFHPTYYSDYFLPYLDGKPFVLTIHDMIPELYPQYFKSNNPDIIFKRELAPKAAAIIAVSHRTKEDIVRILKIPEDKVHVIYHGCSFSAFSNIDSIFEFPYVLYVGDRVLYKHFDLFVRDIAPVLQQYPDLKVVCTGFDFRSDELKQMSALNVKERFIHHWVSSDKEFFALYHYAKCFVYSSEYEGFGIPILEAYKADCPVLLNRSSCFPEIAGDAAVYFTMNTSESNFSSVLERFLQNSNAEVEQLKEKQRLRLALYSWNESAKLLSDIYKSLI